MPTFLIRVPAKQAGRVCDGCTFGCTDMVGDREPGIAVVIAQIKIVPEGGVEPPRGVNLTGF